jgi:hypothetical protein
MLVCVCVCWQRAPELGAAAPEKCMPWVCFMDHVLSLHADCCRQGGWCIPPMLLPEAGTTVDHATVRLASMEGAKAGLPAGLQVCTPCMPCGWPEEVGAAGLLAVLQCVTVSCVSNVLVAVQVLFTSAA